MAYDPKKNRKATDSIDSIVDDIFGEEPKASAKKPAAKKSTSASAKKTVSKTAPKTPAHTAKKPTAKKPASKVTSIEKNKSAKDDVSDNVLPLYPESETPLIMQPQVWVATAIAAVVVLFFVKRRKK